MEREERLRSANKVTLVGSLVNFLLIILKLAAGILGRSQVMIADAVHSISDFATDIVVIVSMKAANKPSDRTHRYGHGKFETLASLLISISLLLVAGGLFYSGVKTIIAFFNGETLHKPGLIAIVMAIVSIICKEALYQYTVIVGKRINSRTVIANAWHHRSDALSSVGALLGLTGAYLLGENWAVLDPIAALFVSVIILKTAFDILFKSINEFLEGALSEKDEEEIMEIITSVPAVYKPHNLKTRNIGSYAVIDFHIEVEGKMSVKESHDITRVIERKLKERFGGETIISIHVEPLGYRSDG